MNQVGLVGRLTKDIELRSISDRPHTSFFLAISRNYRNNQGVVDADYVLCVAWGKLAERIAQYCGKGSLIGIDGKVQCRSYTNRDNKKVYVTEIVAEDVRFYSLKNPTSMPAAHTMDSTQPANPPSSAFTLPEVEEALPILP